jgi:hypothetical protein
MKTKITNLRIVTALIVVDTMAQSKDFNIVSVAAEAETRSKTLAYHT